MLNLNDIQFFVRAAEAGGFAAAARQLGCPKSTVSKRVAELEAGLGVRLIQRTSRSFVLTDVGREFYEHARAAMIEAEAAENVVHRRLAEPRGAVSITASVPTAQLYLADALPKLARQYPKLQLRVHVTDRFVDLVQEGFDIAIRSHFGPLPDSGLVQKQIRTDPFLLVASSGYLQEHGTPVEPQDLSTHDGLMVSPSVKAWDLQHENGRAVRVAPISQLYADESVVLLRAAEAGLGITALPKSIVATALSGGSLVQVLPHWNAGIVTTTVLVPHRRGQLPAVRAVLDCLSQMFSRDKETETEDATLPIR
jgi:DNA-binding transcriptional LysR family regulator